MEAREDYIKWLKKRIKTTKVEYAERLAVGIDTPEKLQDAVAKGGKLRAFKETLAYIETHKDE